MVRVAGGLAGLMPGSQTTATMIEPGLRHPAVATPGPARTPDTALINAKAAEVLSPGLFRLRETESLTS